MKYKDIYEFINSVNDNEVNTYKINEDEYDKIFNLFKKQIHKGMKPSDYKKCVSILTNMENIKCSNYLKVILINANVKNLIEFYGKRSSYIVDHLKKSKNIYEDFSVILYFEELLNLFKIFYISVRDDKYTRNNNKNLYLTETELMHIETINLLRSKNIYTLYDLDGIKQSQIFSINGIKERNIHEIYKTIYRYKLGLKIDVYDINLCDYDMIEDNDFITANHINYHVYIDTLNPFLISTYLENALRENKINDLMKFNNKTRAYILSLPLIGEKCFNELLKLCEKYGIKICCIEDSNYPSKLALNTKMHNLIDKAIESDTSVNAFFNLNELNIIKEALDNYYKKGNRR